MVLTPAYESDSPPSSFVTDLPPPTQSRKVLNQIDLHSSRWLEPQKQIHFYDPGTWEEFIKEWALGLKRYDTVKRFGGSGDKGIDVAGLLTDRGLEGPWDCFQCKHYGSALKPSEFWPEVLKIVAGAMDGHFTFPRRYIILAPLGCGTTLDKLLSTPTSLKSKFMAEIVGGGPMAKKMPAGKLQSVKEFASTLDFAAFRSAQIEKVIEAHSSTCYHVARFGINLPARPATGPPPASPTLRETRYISQLLEVYRERYPTLDFTPQSAGSHSQTKTHYPRQREYFYSAEALRLFARDSIPPGTYEDLVDNLFHCVIQVAESEWATGWERLTHVLSAASNAHLTSNALLTVSDTRDRLGICHQMANEDRLTWVAEADPAASAE